VQQQPPQIDFFCAQLPDLLRQPGDLLVATRPAALRDALLVERPDAWQESLGDLDARKPGGNLGVNDLEGT
jgi:hypothetical protein